MARIAGVDLPRDKRLEVALTYIFGVGLPTSHKIIRELDLNMDTRVKDMTDAELVKVRDYLEENLKVEGDLRRDISQDIKRLMEIVSYRGLRHRRSLPVRGQRTKTNARTRKGPKKLVSGKKKK